MKREWIEILLQAVYEASDRMMDIYHSEFDVDIKSDNSPVTLADKESNRILRKHIEPLNIAILSEEDDWPSYESRKDLEQIWIIDPLDGTKEFVRKNDEFCICIALVENNKAVFGMLADPVKKEVLFGGSSLGSVHHIPYFEEHYLDPKTKCQVEIPEKKTIVYSRSHFSPRVQDFVDQIEAKYGKMEVIRKGSALKFFDLALNKAQFYPRLAPTMEWDIAAGQAIYEAIGGEVADFTNFEALKYNKKDLYNPFFIAKPKGLQIQ